MKRALVAVLVLGTAVSCGKKKDAAKKDGPAGQGQGPTVGPGGAGPMAPAPWTDNTSALWAFAPEGAVFGVVIGDGTGERARAAFKAHLDAVAARPWAKPVLDGLAEAREEMGFDPVDAAGWKSAGVDLSKGVAFFIELGGDDRGDEKPLMILPIVDRAAFREKAKGKVETIDGKEVDRLDDDMVCMPVGDRYFCGRDVKYIEQHAKAHDGGLAAAVKALPAEARGDFELFADVAKIPESKDDLEDMKDLGTIEAAGLSARLLPDGVVVRGWAKGAMTGKVGKLLRAVKANPALDRRAGAASFMRLTVDPALFLLEAPASMPAGPLDARKDGLEQLTGEFSMVTAGTGLAAGAILIGVKDGPKMTASVKNVCGLGMAFAGKPDSPVAKLDVHDTGCKGEISLAMLEKEVGFTVPNFPFELKVDGNVLIVRIGQLDLTKLAAAPGDDAGSWETSQMLGGPATFVAWSRGLDFDVGQLPPKLQEMMGRMPEAQQAMDFWSWVAATVYETGFALSVNEDGATAVLRVTTFSGDPDEATAAYKAAREKRKAGDRAGYSAAMAEIAKKWPGSKTGKRAAIADAPLVGPGGALVVGGMVSFLFLARKVEEAAPPRGAAVEPGFGGALDIPIIAPDVDTKKPE